LTALAAEPAVRAAERAIVTGSSAVLAETLAVSAAAESRCRLDHVLDLKARADNDPELREAYQRAADDLRRWAATIYLAAVRRAAGLPAAPAPSISPDDRVRSRETAKPVHGEEHLASAERAAADRCSGRRNLRPAGGLDEITPEDSSCARRAA
jgi:hypothetical protein